MKTRKKRSHFLLLMVTKVNAGFGNRCCICGSFFDEDGVCNNKHQKDYPMLKVK